MTNTEILISISAGIIVPVSIFFANKQWGRKKYLLSKYNTPANRRCP